jgi:hypothetical protein
MQKAAGKEENAGRAEAYVLAIDLGGSESIITTRRLAW